MSDHVADASAYAHHLINLDTWGRSYEPLLTKTKLSCPSPIKLGGMIKTWMVMSNAALDLKHWNKLVYEIALGRTDMLLKIKQSYIPQSISLTLTIMNDQGMCFEEVYHTNPRNGAADAEKLYNEIVRVIDRLHENAAKAIHFGDFTVDPQQHKAFNNWHEGMRLMPRE